MTSKISEKRQQRYRNLILKKVITDHCLECVGWPRGKVSKCSNNTCSLYPQRTGKGKFDVTQREKAIRERCLGCLEDLREVRRCPYEECDLWPFRMSANESEGLDDDYEEDIFEGMDEAAKNEIMKNIERYLNSPSDYVPPPCPTVSTIVPTEADDEKKV
jgi:hypothetical protein